MEGLFLLSAAYLFVVIVYPSVRSGLLCIEAFQGFIKQAVIHFPDTLVTIADIEVSTLWVGILGVEFPAVVVDGAFSNHDADGSFQI